VNDTVRPPSIFTTESLRLRPPEPDDAQALFEAYGSDPDATRWLTWQPKNSSNEMREFLGRAKELQASGREFFWVIEEKTTQKAIGMISFEMSEAGPELGYVLSKAFWGRGYMAEAAGVLVRWLLEQPSIYRVWAVCDVENAASVRVLEKIGMEKEGILRRWVVHPNVSGEPRDVYVYSIVK
jgi:ribosomal-protein-alanine N-acetyltransferase